MTARSVKKSTNFKDQYDLFDEINGTHPWQEEVPGSYVPYLARYRKGGKIAYFNFELAIEMGLIKEDHPFKMNQKLEDKLLETFSLVIINEYDLINGRKFNPSEVRPNPYMATRYLQLQHPSKKGLTSGDGRSIWNGQFFNGKNYWDVSSCGTGATCLSPATAIQQKFFKTGDPSISYGCGYSDLQDGVSAAVMSEVFHRKNIPTERTLLVIEYPGKISVNVRASKNLLRPSHFFNHLKQGHFERLKSGIDFYIKKQKQNNEWKKVPKAENEKYEYFLQKMVEIFSDTSARFESEYIFCWLDWDGDNILMDGGIIDYGSVRQFDLCHHEYRYDDVERWSTTILEQKNKAKYIVQTFAQLVDFLKNGEKRNIKEFTGHSSLKNFEKHFEDRKCFYLARKVGFTDKECQFLLEKKYSTLKKFLDVYNFFERETSPVGKRKVPDGITEDAVFCLRSLHYKLPLMLRQGQDISHALFLSLIRTSYTKPKNLELTNLKKKNIDLFLSLYKKLVLEASKYSNSSLPRFYISLEKRAEKLHRSCPITGDAVIHIANELIKARKKLNDEDFYGLVNLIFNTYGGDGQLAQKKKTRLFLINPQIEKLFNKINLIIENLSEGL
jgi:hypothetical protein